jgi:hypothetical protein
MTQTDIVTPQDAAPTQRPIVLMNRTDGLGERLCAMINAIRFADTLDRNFRFFWTSDIWNPVYHKLSTEKDKPILGQSIAPQEEIFSAAFIEKYALKTHNPKDYRACPPKPITHAKFTAAETAGRVMGWVPNQNFMENVCDSTFMTTVKMSSAEAFAKISFAPDIVTLLKAANQTVLPRFDAIHLRSGDMIFGEVRKWGQWGNKVLNLSVAQDLITKIQGEGRQVVLFGQDVDGLTALAKDRGCMFVGDMIPSSAVTATQRALFEIMLMSRAQDIYAGYSGFSRAACMIGNKRARTPHQLYTSEEYVDITLAGLAQEAGKYHPLVNAYSYWQAYDLGEQFFNLPEQYDIITLAANNDSENLLYPVLQAALLYRMGQDDAAEALIADQIEKQPDNGFIVQLVFKYYSTDFTHRRQFNDFHGAARRAGNHQAKICTTAIQKALK